MDIQELNLIKSKFVSRTVGNDLILVPLSGNVAQMNKLFTLNETGRFIWEKSDESNTIEEMAIALTEAFNIDLETATNDVKSFLEKFKTTI